MAMNEADIAPATTDLAALESLGGLLDDFVIEGAPVDDTTPLPTDASAADAGADQAEGSKAAAVAQDEVKTDAVEDVKAKPEGEEVADSPDEAVTVDPELSVSDNEIVNSRPPAERPELQRRLKSLTFEDHFVNHEKPKKEVADYLFQRSQSNAAELQQEMVSRALADPMKFAADYYNRDSEGYGRFVATLVKGDSTNYFAKEVAGRDVTPEQIREAIDFHERNKDRILETTDDLSDEELKDLEEEFPDVAPKLKSKLSEAARDKVEVTRLKAEVERLAAPKEDKKADEPATVQTAPAHESEVYQAAEDVVNSFITGRLDRATGDGLGLAVTDAEKTAAPEVAMFKLIKRGLLLEGGLEDLPSFRYGFGDWAQAQDDVKKVGSQIARFVDVNEKANAVGAAQKLLPYSNTYLNERLAHPIFKFLDDRIAEAVTRVGKQPVTEDFIPGTAPSVAAKPPTSFDDLMDTYVPAKK